MLGLAGRLGAAELEHAQPRLNQCHDQAADAFGLGSADPIHLLHAPITGGLHAPGNWLAVGGAPNHIAQLPVGY